MSTEHAAHAAGHRASPANRLATVTRLVPAGATSAEPVPFASVQGALALDLQGLRGVPAAPEADLSRTARVEALEDARVKEWAARFAQAVVEAAGGHRPLSQLVRWTSPEVYRQLDQRVRLLAPAARAGRPSSAHRALRPQVRSVHVCRPTGTTAEVSVHVRHGQRSRALAARLERRQERWVCTALVLG